MKRITAIAVLLSLAVAAMAQDANKKYEIKSGIVKTVTEVMGQEIETMSYFDNYGALEVTKTCMSIPGAGEIEVSTINRDGKVYVVNKMEKKVQEAPAPESVNYLNLTDEIIKKYNIVNLSKETLDGRECSKYKVEMSKDGQTVSSTVWVWKGYVIKSILTAGGMEIVSEVVEFTEDAYILPQTFEVPVF